jgi:hypothetical protein
MSFIIRPGWWITNLGINLEVIGGDVGIGFMRNVCPRTHPLVVHAYDAAQLLSFGAKLEAARRRAKHDSVSLFHKI